MTSAVLVAIVVVVGFETFCLVDLHRASEFGYLPKWAWAAICVVSVPLGGIVYLSVGKVPLKTTILDSHAAPIAPVARRSPSSSVREDSPAIIEVDRLTKHFGSVVALDGLSFVVRSGHVTGFLGPNGAGKSTTMRTILGLDAPTIGQALVGGRRYQEIVRPLHQVGSLLDANALHPGRTACQHLRAVARSNGIGTRRVTEVLRLTGVEAVADRLVRTFSLGMKQRLGIAVALLGDPPVLVFDEPVNGLDPEGVHWSANSSSRSPPRAGPFSCQAI
jgi:ABC-type glutathione transport system ATPase component